MDWEISPFASFTEPLVLTLFSFYTDVACISAATVGTVLLVSKIFDGISDMMMGYIIENVHSPLGKARPWLLWMVIPYCIGCVLLFTVPDFSETGKVIYAFYFL